MCQISRLVSTNYIREGVPILVIFTDFDGHQNRLPPSARPSQLDRRGAILQCVDNLKRWTGSADSGSSFPEAEDFGRVRNFQIPHMGEFFIDQLGFVARHIETGLAALLRVTFPPIFGPLRTGIFHL